MVNFVALVEQDIWTRESWTEQANIADVLAAFEGWNPQVLSILGAVDETFVGGSSHVHRLAIGPLDE